MEFGAQAFSLHKGENPTRFNFARWLHTFCYWTSSGNFITLKGFTDRLRGDAYHWVSLQLCLPRFSVVRSWDCPCCMSYSLLPQQWKLLSWSITLHKIKPRGLLQVVTDSFLFHFKPWVTEVKYSDPSLHLASKGGIQPLYTVGTAASKDIASIHTGKCLQHLLITSRGRQDFPRGSLWAQAQSTPLQQNSCSGWGLQRLYRKGSFVNLLDSQFL